MSPPKTGVATPHEVRVRMYRVGFGDCFLVLFNYRRRLADGRNQRSVLIDFGRTRTPRGRRGPDLPAVARQISQDCGGTLDVVVVSHRHSR